MSAPLKTKRFPAEPYFPVLRTLVETYFAFLARDAVAIRAQGLTASQFDVVATLGNTPGMACRELSERTLVTKGTLTGVLDRLEAKRLIERLPSATDRRSIHVRLTKKGEELFRRALRLETQYALEFSRFVEGFRTMNQSDAERLYP